MWELKKILSILERQKEKLENLVQHREDVYSDRSYEWQESEKWEDYQDTTYEIENSVLYPIEEAIESIENLL